MFILKNMFESKTYSNIMLLSVFMYTFSVVPFPTISDIFRAVFIIGSLGIFYFHRDRIYKEPMVILLFLIILVQVLSWLNSLIYIPELSNSSPKIDRLGKLFLFIFMAYWLKGSIKNVYILWGCYIIGFLMGCIVHSDFIKEFSSGLQGNRIDFNIKNAQYTSMFSGLSFIFCFFHLILLSFTKNLASNIKIRIIGSITLFILSVLFFTMIVISQSRMVWLAILITITLLPLLFSICSEKIKLKHTLFGYVVIFILMFFIIKEIAPMIEKRSGQGDMQSIYKIIDLDTDNIPMSSVGIRLNSWIESIPWFNSHPILGLDSNTPGLIISQSKLFSERINENYGIIKGLRHLHNFHIEMLVSYGIIGLLLIYALYINLPRSLLSIREQLPNANLWIFLSLCCITYWLTINAFESFNSRNYGVYSHNVFFAGLYTFYLAIKLDLKDKSVE
ncbi:O-antigen ligase [Aliivibrio sp. EL58]|uniref:O-antigen ligase family protein n=1 Tax=Aliivibrio sp. EL58 TaxID=2107582 RepID=UPI000EFCA27C|nr:O-antigen ligase family protein [Aliivibrio sp. EL58]